MHFSLDDRTVTLSVGEFAGFSLGPRESGGGPQGLWRAQLGQHWHNELRARTESEFTVGGALRPDVRFEVPIDGRLVHRGWTFALQGRIDQQIGATLREIKSVTRPLPANETDLRADYPAYFLQLSAYVLLVKAGTTSSQLITDNRSALRAELIFVEAGSGLAQTIALTPFDEALVFHQLDALVEFLNLRLRATARRRALQFHSPFTQLRTGQETIQQDLAAAFAHASTIGQSKIENRAPPDRDEWRASPTDASRATSTSQRENSKILFLEAPTGYGKTGCVLEFALGQLKSGRFARLIWLTGKSTGQIHVMHTLRLMAPDVKGSDPSTHNQESITPNPGTPVPVWQVRNKSEHCVNHTFHCVRDGCNYLRDCAERWPGSGLSRFYLNENEPRDLDTLRAAGRSALICPYEITRAALPFNDVWLGDFNYVFAPDNRSLFFDQPGFDPAETLLVVDEAHNLPSRVAGAYSHSASENDARLLLAELDHLQAPSALVLAVEEWTRLLASLEPAESLDPGTEAEVVDLLERLTKLTANHPLDYTALGPKHSETLWSFSALLEWLENAETNPVSQSRTENQAPRNRDEWRASSTDASRAASTQQRDKSKIQGLLWVARSGQLEFTCVDAAAAIGETLRPFGGAILMSATLQPYAEFAESCGLVGRVASDKPRLTETVRPTFQTLTAPTPWRAGAYDVAVDLRVDTTFRQRSTHYATTAATIVTLHEASAKVPSGEGWPQAGVCRTIAVFFPSYAYAEAIAKTLSDYGSVLRVALQPKLPDLAAQTAWVEENLVLSDAMFLVLGSSFAEGIDLLGGRITHAMVVGPALPEVNAVQKARLAALSDLGREAAFRRVYQIPGLQKVNQGLGRLVRAPGQKAKVLLHCRRFAEPSYASLLAADYQMFTEIADDAGFASWLRMLHHP
jgi:DNA excision repair protein ERCC-2